MKFFTKKNQSGFTIIEVMIVLAIAGVIMLALFLAVPALQRNSRNNQRDSDAALFTAGINECINARNGSTSSCDSYSSGTELGQFIDPTKLKQLITIAPSSGATPASPVAGTVYYQFGAKCDTDSATFGQFTTTGASPRQFSVGYLIESTSGNILKCIES
jgi:prepilin-type N-terminal cleavage/methylation domain-containing protein